MLIVEDGPQQAKLLALLLQAEGYRTRTVATAEAALDALADGLPALMTLDYNLPGMSGAELLQQMRADPRLAELPVLLITANPTIPQAVVAQAQALIIKPYDVDALIAAIQRYCGKP